MNKSMKKISKTLVSVSLAAAMAVTMAASASAYSVKNISYAGYLRIDNTYSQGGWYTWENSEAAKQFPQITGAVLTQMTNTETRLDYKTLYSPQLINGKVTRPKFYSANGMVAAVLDTKSEYNAVLAAENLKTVKGTEFRWLQLEGDSSIGYALRNVSSQPEITIKKAPRVIGSATIPDKCTRTAVHFEFTVDGCYAGLDFDVTDNYGTKYEVIKIKETGTIGDDYTANYYARGAVETPCGVTGEAKIKIKPVSCVERANKNQLVTGSATSTSCNLNWK